MSQPHQPSAPIGVPSVRGPGDERPGHIGVGINGGAGEAPEGPGSALQRLRESLLAAVPPDRARRLGEHELRSELVRVSAEQAVEGQELLEYGAQETVITEVIDELVGFGPIGGLMREVGLSEILINGPHQIYVERRGQLHPDPAQFRDEEHLLQVLRRLVALTGRRLDRTAPMVDTRLPDGSRLNAVLKPPALNGPLVSIRRFGTRPLTTDDLLANESLTVEMLEFLSACVRGRVNILISGGTGSGKSTLLNALSRFIPGTERLVTIEDTAELELQQIHVAKLEAQPAGNDGQGEVTMRDLVRNALRMRPDRIIVGECRGAETLEMLQAMNTGHEGSMSTVHANASREALTRVELMCSLSGVEIPMRSIRTLVTSAVGLVVQVGRLPGGARKVLAISELTGMEGETYTMHDLFTFQTVADPGRDVLGFFQATGMRPHLLNKLAARGVAVPFTLFAPGRLPTTKERGTGR